MTQIHLEFGKKILSVGVRKKNPSMVDDWGSTKIGERFPFSKGNRPWLMVDDRELMKLEKCFDQPREIVDHRWPMVGGRQNCRSVQFIQENFLMVDGRWSAELTRCSFHPREVVNHR
jgi:hypothetical protein